MLFFVDSESCDCSGGLHGCPVSCLYWWNQCQTGHQNVERRGNSHCCWNSWQSFWHDIKKCPSWVFSLFYRCYDKHCYIPRLSLNQTGTVIVWFFVTWPWLKSNVLRLWYIKQCTLLGIHYSTWSKHGGKWRDRRREKHCQFSFLWMNTTTQTWSLKLKSNNFQSYPRRETAASGWKKMQII